MAPSIATLALLLAAMDQHCEECEQCNGPNDGCETGQSIESTLIGLSETNPYDMAPQEVTKACATASIRVLSGKANVLNTRPPSDGTAH